MASGTYSISRGGNSVNTLMVPLTNFITAYVMGLNDTRLISIAELRLTRPKIDVVHFSSTEQFVIRLEDSEGLSDFIANPDTLALPQSITGIGIQSMQSSTITVEFWSLFGATGGVLRGGYSDGYSDGFDILHTEGF